MEKRSAERHIISFKAELLYESKSYTGLVENISENGVHIIAYPFNKAINFTSGTGFDLKFQLASGEVAELPCSVRWSYKTPPQCLSFGIGTEIMEPSLKYKEFLKSLSLRIRKPRVIILSDEDIISNSLEKWLSRNNYEVLTFNDPRVCPICGNTIGDCMKERPCADIIITGFNMSEMNGFELLQNQSLKGCKIDNRNKAVVSGYTDNNILKAINKSGFFVFNKSSDLSLISDWLNGCEKRIDLSLPLGGR